MSLMRNRIIAIIFAALLLASITYESYGKRKRRAPNPIIEFLRENGVDLDKKVVLIRVTAKQLSGEVPRAVMKVIAIRDGLTEGAKKFNADVIKTVVAAIVNGTVIETGDTPKIADLEIFLEDGSSFKVFVGENFSQIVFEKITSAPENPFSSEPVEKEVEMLSFVSPELTKSIKIILQPKDVGEQ